MQTPILKVKDLSKSFLGLQALKDFNLEVQPGEILGLIGPNGSGKTTCFNVLTGFLHPTTGSIEFAGDSLSGLSPARITRLGLARTFQNIRLFRTLTVLENVRSSAQLHTRYSLAEALLGTRAYRKKERAVLARTQELLSLMNLGRFQDQRAGNLPYGSQRRLEIARALATQPKMLLLDEPAAGMNSAESDALNQLILELRERFDLTIILVEHDMRLVMNLCDRVMVLNYGRTLVIGAPEIVRNDPQVITAYLGDSDAVSKGPTSE
jgi:branched-chain amino acid transport system ATP-binding protein